MMMIHIVSDGHTKRVYCDRDGVAWVAIRKQFREAGKVVVEIDSEALSRPFAFKADTAEEAFASITNTLPDLRFAFSVYYDSEDDPIFDFGN